jgi:GH15 family glucan-1,4-alpha-glucosidase
MEISSTADLRRASVATIHAGQSPEGGYVASPRFPPYAFSWLRDGAFIADAMSLVGERGSAERFFDWVAAIVRRGDGLRTRYRVDGSDDTGSDSDWPMRQWDGWGLWLWAVRRHRERGGASRRQEEEARVQEWLRAHWREPCHDWWEEQSGLHAVTLGCLLAGGVDDPELARAFREDADWRLDASLLALAAPLDVVEPAELPLDRLTAELVSPGGGVHRHPTDEYYGGGEWLLLTALLGLVELRLGRADDARRRLEWIAAHASADGTLPEQSQEHLLRPERYGPWVDKWGPPPSPLLWSHAMFLVLDHELGTP